MLSRSLREEIELRTALGLLGRALPHEAEPAAQEVVKAKAIPESKLSLAPDDTRPTSGATLPNLTLGQAGEWPDTRLAGRPPWLLPDTVAGAVDWVERMVRATMRSQPVARTITLLHQSDPDKRSRSEIATQQRRDVTARLVAQFRTKAESYGSAEVRRVASELEAKFLAGEFEAPGATATGSASGEHEARRAAYVGHVLDVKVEACTKTDDFEIIVSALRAADPGASDHALRNAAKAALRAEILKISGAARR